MVKSGRSKSDDDIGFDASLPSSTTSSAPKKCDCFLFAFQEKVTHLVSDSFLSHPSSSSSLLFPITMISLVFLTRAVETGSLDSAVERISSSSSDEYVILSRERERERGFRCFTWKGKNEERLWPAVAVDGIQLQAKFQSFKVCAFFTRHASRSLLSFALSSLRPL